MILILLSVDRITTKTTTKKIQLIAILVTLGSVASKSRQFYIYLNSNTRL